MAISAAVTAASMLSACSASCARVQVHSLGASLIRGWQISIVISSTSDMSMSKVSNTTAAAYVIICLFSTAETSTPMPYFRSAIVTRLQPACRMMKSAVPP